MLEKYWKPYYKKLVKCLSKLSSRTKQHLTELIFIILFGCVGTILLISSHAATPYASINADTGTITGDACTVSVADGMAVQFGDCSSAAPANTKLPFITGVTETGQVLTANPGTWTNNPSYTYQWQDCAESGGSCSNISGATSSTYTIQGSDVADTIQVLVTAHNSSGTSSPATSSGTGSPSWNASGPTPVVLGSVSPTWEATYDGTWGNSSNGCSGFDGDSGYTGWWGFDGNASGSGSGGYIGDLGWSYQGAASQTAGQDYFSFTNGSSASSPAFSGQAADLFVDQNATTTGEVAERSNLNQCAIDPAFSTAQAPVDDSPSGAYEGSNVWYRMEVYFPSNYVPEPVPVGGGDTYNWVAEFHNPTDSGNTCCGNITFGAVTDTEDGGAANPAGRLSMRILGGGTPSDPVPNGANMYDSAQSADYDGTINWTKGPQLELNHWYDILLHVKWGYEASGPNEGEVQWWLDGNELTNYNGPTLYYMQQSSWNLDSTTTSAISSGSTITSLADSAGLSPSDAQIPAGPVGIENGSNWQILTTSGTGEGATSIPITGSPTANASYPAGSTITIPGPDNDYFMVLNYRFGQRPPCDTNDCDTLGTSIDHDEDMWGPTEASIGGD